MKEFEFNMNSHVKVKLTPKGIKYFVDNQNKWRPETDKLTISQFKSRLDDKGYYKFQLWCFIDCFGGLDMSLSKYVETDIVINEKDLVEI